MWWRNIFGVVGEKGRHRDAKGDGRLRGLWSRGLILLVCLSLSWPTSLEVQGANGSHGSFIAIGGKAVGLTNAKFEPATLLKVRNKVGEWNTTEVSIKNGDVLVKVNGTQVNSGKITLVEGPFGFQSEGSEIHFKNIKIKVLD